MTRAIRSDSRLVIYFNTPEIFTLMTQLLLTPTENSLIQSVICYIKEVSSENLLLFDNKIFTSLYFIHQSQSRASKDVVQIFTNIIKSSGSKQLIKNTKDYFKFALTSINDFKTDTDKLMTEIYKKDMITIDVDYLLSTLEMVYNLIMETSSETLMSEITIDKVNKLEGTAGFFYD